MLLTKCPSPSIVSLLPFMSAQLRFKRSKKRKMVPRIMNEVKRETLGFPSGPSLGSIIGNPQSPYEVAKNVKHHLARLSASDTTHIRRKKDFGRYNYHRILRAAGLSHDNNKIYDDHDGFITPLTQLQRKAELPPSNFHDRFPFPHILTYKAYWGPPTVDSNPNRTSQSVDGVSVSFRVEDLPFKRHEIEKLLDIVGPQRFDEATGVVTVTADVFPNRNHNAACLGDVLQQLIKLSSEEI